MFSVRSLISCLAALGLVGLGSASYADARVVVDSAADVVLIDINGDTVAAAPERNDGDIRRVRITYAEDHISGVISFAALDRPDARLLVRVNVRWSSSQDDRGGLVIIASERRPEGVARFYTNAGACPVQHHVDYAHDRVTFSLASSCIGDPGWIQAFTHLLARARHTEGMAWVDAAPDKTYGPRIHHG